MDDKEDLPRELNEAFIELGRAMAEFWPHAVARIKDRSPGEHADMVEYLNLGGVMRAVFHFQPRPAIALELIDHQGKPKEFYRIYGKIPPMRLH